MKGKFMLGIMVLVLLLAVVPLACSQTGLTGEGNESASAPDTTGTEPEGVIITTDKTEYEQGEVVNITIKTLKNNKDFKRYEIGDRIVYRHQRMIDGAIVNGDHISYVFDSNTKELIKEIGHWRDDLPEHLPAIISKEEAEAIAGGGSALLYYIKPDSHVLPIKPTPENPCWVVWIRGDNNQTVDILVIDAVEGKILGHGVPPP